MAKNVMKQLKPSANLGRNAFDLSHRNVFTANFGELLPCCCIETVPSEDYVEIKPSDLVRAMPLVTSPFLRAKQHIDFWFVPYQALWSRFNEFMVDKDEPVSSSLNYRDYIPHTALSNLYITLNQDYTKKDIVGRSLKQGGYKLLNLLGYGASDEWLGDQGNYQVNLFRLAAYNFIWYKEYRQKYFDDGRHLMPSSSLKTTTAFLWNFDDLPCDDLQNSDPVYVRETGYCEAMLQMRYRCWKKDLFTGLMPSQQFGDVSQITSQNVKSVLEYVYNVNDAQPTNRRVLTTYDGKSFISAAATDGNIPSTWKQDEIALKTGVLKSQVDVLSLRKAEAVQKWRENALRAGNQIEDNFEAHYGTKPHSHLISHPTYIGSYDSSLNIGDVISTAQTGEGSNQSLGDIAGKGIMSLDGKTLKFKTTDFGVIMGIFSLLPEAEYNALGVDRMNQLLEREDFFVPEYENLGLEPVNTAVFYAGELHGDNAVSLLGFAPRYWGYKQKFDQCFGEMMHTSNRTGLFSHWCSPKTDVPAQLLTADGVLPLSCLYVNPALFDINFNVSVENSDQFLVDMFNDVTAIRGMSVQGMPSY